MAVYLVWSGGNGTDGTEAGGWANAFQTFAAGVAAATAAGDVVKVAHTHIEVLSASATYTLKDGVSYVTVDKNTGALAQMDGTNGYIGNLVTTGYTIVLNGNSRAYVYGVAFIVGPSGTFLNLSLANSSGAHHEYESCLFSSASGGASSGGFIIGTTSAGNVYAKFKNCTFENKRAATKGFFHLNHSNTDIDGCTVTTVNSMPYMFRGTEGMAQITGCDFSGVDAPIVQLLGTEFAISNSSLHPSLTTIVDVAGLTKKTAGEVNLYNCSQGDTHYQFGHFDALGSTLIETGIYEIDGASPDGGTTRTSWKIVATANAAFSTPYVSPWIDKYWDGTSAITPYLEMLRDGSATAFYDDEVWAEVSYQGVTGTTQATLVSGRMSPIGSPSANPAGAGLSNWTGESGTAWSGKLQAGSVTPAEVGDLRARVFVGLANAIVYVDPRIRT